jgi:FMN phosphatase YigB (HAD superfamily)
MRNFLRAICWIPGGIFLELSKLKIFSVPLHLKLLITTSGYSITRLTTSVKCEPSSTCGRKDVAPPLRYRFDWDGMRCNTFHRNVTLVLKSWALDPQIHLNRAVSAFFTYFQRNAKAYDDSCEVISKLGSKGLKVGVLTDVPYGMPASFVRKDLTRAGILSGIDTVVTSSEAGYRKPHVAPFIRLAEMLKATPSELVYIGNEEKDIRGAKNSGMTSVLIDREERNLDYGQDFTLSELTELFTIIEG